VYLGLSVTTKVCVSWARVGRLGEKCGRIGVGVLFIWLLSPQQVYLSIYSMCWKVGIRSSELATWCLADLTFTEKRGLVPSLDISSRFDE